MKKLIALEPEVYAKLKPETKILSELDQRMSEILTSDRPDHEKAILYNEALRKSRFFRLKSQKNKAVPVKEVKEARSLTEQEILQPLRKKARARELLRNVKSNKVSGWNSKGELVLDQRPVPASDLTKLLRTAVSKKPDKTLAGWKEFESVAWESV